MGRLLGRIWVGFTTCLIAFIAYSSQIFIIWPWYGRELSVDLLTLLLPFNFLIGMIYWNYYLTVTTDPGRVPRGWSPDTRSEEGRHGHITADNVVDVYFEWIIIVPG
ncbi:PFA4_3 [Sanghuangporus sanghuang]